MTIFEEYLSSKKEENKAEVNCLWNYHDYINHMCNVVKGTATLGSCVETLNKYDEIKEKRVSIGTKICELSFITDKEASFILSEFLKDYYLEDFELESLVIDNERRIFLIKKGASLDFEITMDNLLTNENIIFLASTTYPNGFNLYQIDEKLKEVYCEIDHNIFFDDTPNYVKSLKEFIDGYINAKSERKELSLTEYFENNLVNYLYQTSIDIKDYYAFYHEHDKEEQRRIQRQMANYYHKKQREAKNKIIAKRKLEKLPNKYMPQENVSTLTFVRRLELMVGRHFSSKEKDDINSWLILGFDKDIIMKAYNEASIRGNYNTSAIAKILDELTPIKRFSSLDNLEKVLTNELGFTKEDIVGLTKKFPE